jgi:uncharacterized protein
MNPLDIINEYYIPGSRLYEILVRHGEDVAAKAASIAANAAHLKPDPDFIYEASMLHDIGIFLTDAPKLFCMGNAPYVCHGYLGRNLLDAQNLPKHALVCERHVGCGITIDDIRTQKLPLPERDMTPISLEEKIVCYADKFFSKKGLLSTTEKNVEEVLKSLAKLGPEKADIFLGWVELFGA